MGKIKQLTEDLLINGKSKENIYPITSSDAVLNKEGKSIEEITEEIKSGTFLEDDSIESRHIKDGSITTEDLKDYSISSEKIKANSVTSIKLDSYAVIEPKIASNAVTTRIINNGAVTTAKIEDGAIDTSKLDDESVSTEKLQDRAVTTDKLYTSAVIEEKLANASVTTNKIKDAAVTRDKIAKGSIVNTHLSDSCISDYNLQDAIVDTRVLADEAVETDKIVDYNVTNVKLATNSVNSRTIENSSVTTSKLDDKAVTVDKVATDAISTEKLQNKSVTSDKIADNTLTLDKFDEDLRNSLEAATGLPEDILAQFQDITENVSELQDAQWPIVPNLSLSFNRSTKTHTVTFTVTSKGSAFVGDEQSLIQYSNSANAVTLSDIPASSGTTQAEINGGKQSFILTVKKKNRATKTASAIRYMCYAGANFLESLTSGSLTALTLYSSSNVAFNPSITTENNQYVWFAVPNELTINRVTSSGFDVTLTAVSTINTSWGTYKVYRTANTLTLQSWNFVIS
jgi:hypothetical protein